MAEGIVARSMLEAQALTAQLSTDNSEEGMTRNRKETEKQKQKDFDLIQRAEVSEQGLGKAPNPPMALALRESRTRWAGETTGSMSQPACQQLYRKVEWKLDRSRHPRPRQQANERRAERHPCSRLLFCVHHQSLGLGDRPSFPAAWNKGSRGRGVAGWRAIQAQPLRCQGVTKLAQRRHGVPWMMGGAQRTMRVAVNGEVVSVFARSTRCQHNG
jgi:hypothetical protein